MTDRKAALEALDQITIMVTPQLGSNVAQRLATIRAALSEPAAEPVAWMVYFKRRGDSREDCIPVISRETACVEDALMTRIEPLYAAPPAQEGEVALV